MHWTSHRRLHSCYVSMKIGTCSSRFFKISRLHEISLASFRLQHLSSITTFIQDCILWSKVVPYNKCQRKTFTVVPRKISYLLLKYIQSNMKSKSIWIDMISFLCQSNKCSWMLFVNNIIKTSHHNHIERSLYKRCFIQGRMQYMYVANPVYAWENT